jgi:hypothetical protein
MSARLVLFGNLLQFPIKSSRNLITDSTGDIEIIPSIAIPDLKQNRRYIIIII